MLQEISGEITPERMKRWSQSKINAQLWMWLVMEVKFQCCKEWYCLGTWNVGSMNQGKLEGVKQEMTTVNTDILGIGELKWTGMWVNLTQMTIISTTVGKIPWKKWSSHHNQQKSPKCSNWIQSQKWQKISVCFQGKQFNITVIQIYTLTSNAEEAEVE